MDDNTEQQTSDGFIEHVDHLDNVLRIENSGYNDKPMLVLSINAGTPFYVSRQDAANIFFEMEEFFTKGKISI